MAQRSARPSSEGSSSSPRQRGALVAHHVDRVGDDARSVGEAMKHVGGMRSEDVADGLVAVEAIMATRRSVAAVRIEIPSRAVSVVLAKEGSDRSDATPSTEEQRRRADDDARGITVELLDDRRALLIASVGAAKSGGAGLRDGAALSRTDA
jgi:hypothetical protein